MVAIAQALLSRAISTWTEERALVLVGLMNLATALGTPTHENAFVVLQLALYEGRERRDRLA